MNRKTLLTALAAATMACTAFAVQGTQFSGLSCTDEDQGGNASIYCKTAVGPASLTHKSIVGVGIAACQDDEDPATPLPCDPETGTLIPSAGGAIFLNDYAEAPTQDIRFELWVGDSNVICPPGPAVVLCGFDVLFCNDRDFDGLCTNVNDDSDQLRSTQSNEPLIGEACPPGNKDKDEKRCGVDDLDAYIQACFMPLESKNGPDGHWAPGQLVAFIGAWADSWPADLLGFPTNIGTGVSAGFYDVWLREGPGCIVSACDDRADNDGDGTIDYPGDRQCLNEDDTSEEGTPQPGGIPFCTRRIVATGSTPPDPVFPSPQTCQFVCPGDIPGTSVRTSIVAVVGTGVQTTASGTCVPAGLTAGPVNGPNAAIAPVPPATVTAVAGILVCTISGTPVTGVLLAEGTCALTPP